MSPELEALVTEARDPNTLPDRLEVLSKSDKVEVRRALLDNPNLCPTDSQGQLNTELLWDLSKVLPEEVAGSTLFLLHALIEPTDEMGAVVENVAKYTKDAKLIERLWSTWGPISPWARQAIAENHNTPEHILRILGNRETENEWFVLKAVGRNESTPIKTLRVLSTESDWSVRMAVARNRHTPEDILLLLSNPQSESNADVRIEANETLRMHNYKR